MNEQINIVAVIPARLASVRLKRKVLIDILGLPMIEHVRRRVINSGLFDRVIVVSGDDEILNTVSRFGGEVIQTFDKHLNGSSRVAEIINSIQCTHVVVVQGDEPVIQKLHLFNIVEGIKMNPAIDSWSSTSELKKDDLNKVNVVKALLNEEGRIFYCCRKSPSVASFDDQSKYIKKVQGLIAYKKSVLIQLSSLSQTLSEKHESIEQLKIIENGFILKSILQPNQVPSINSKEDLDELYEYLEFNKDQYDLTIKIISNIF